MVENKNGFHVEYDSLMAVLGGTAAAAVFTSISAPDYVTMLVFLFLWAVVFVIGYVLQVQIIRNLEVN